MHKHMHTHTVYAGSDGWEKMAWVLMNCTITILFFCKYDDVKYLPHAAFDTQEVGKTDVSSEWRKTAIYIKGVASAAKCVVQERDNVICS